MEVINNILENRTYTVKSSVSYYDGLREVTGRVVDIDEYQGVSWTGDTSGMYQDSDAGLGEGRQIGYGSYDERTFQYIIDENGQLTNPRFIDEMEGYAHDAGLFNYFDSRDNFDSLLSTFNIFYGLEIYDLASYEMEYLSTLKPLEGSTYRFTFKDEFTSIDYLVLGTEDNLDDLEFPGIDEIDTEDEGVPPIPQQELTLILFSGC